MEITEQVLMSHKHDCTECQKDKDHNIYFSKMICKTCLCIHTGVRVSLVKDNGFTTKPTNVLHKTTSSKTSEKENNKYPDPTLLANTRDKINWNNYLENETQEITDPLFENLMIAHKFGEEDMGHQEEDNQMRLIAMSTLKTKRLQQSLSKRDAEGI